MSSLGSRYAPKHTGRMFGKKTIKSIGVGRKDPYLRQRMKADDSRAVNMTDRTLSRGISSY
jgi:hypothetical protein